MLKCKSGHTMDAGQKFCGECGSGADTGELACGKCSGMIAKAQNFCTGCGEKAPEEAEPLSPELTAALGEVDAFAKAAAAFAKDNAALPEVVLPEGEGDPVAKIIAKGRGLAGAGTDDDGDIDAAPVLAEMLRLQGTGTAMIKSYAGQNLAVLGQLQAGVTIMAKAFSALAAENGTLRGEVRALRRDIEAFGQRGRGRKVPDAAPLAKGAADKGGPLEGIADMPLGQVMAKASAGLEVQDVSLLNVYSNRGMTLHQLAGVDPDLAMRAYRAIPAAA